MEGKNAFKSAINLAKQTITCATLLHKTHQVFFKLLKDDICLKKAIWRYEKLWIPLMLKQNESSSFKPIPPPDIHLMWFLHVLCGEKYKQSDHQKNTQFQNSFQMDLGTDLTNEVSTKTIWATEYPQEPYICNYQKVSDDIPPSDSGLQSHLVNIMNFIKPLIKVVGLPHFVDETFISEAVERYERFMELVQSYPNECLLPALDVQLVWISHQLATIDYEDSIQKYLGKVVSTLDMLYLRSTSKHYGQSTLEKVEALWNTKYSEEFVVSGAIAKFGQDEMVEFIQIPEELKAPEQDQFCDISVNNICVSEIWSREKKITIEMRRLAENSFNYQHMFRTATKVKHPVQIRQVQDVGRVKFDMRNHRGFEINIYGKNGKMCVSSEEHIATVFWDPRKAFDGGPVKNGEVSITLPRIYKSDPKVNFVANFKLHKIKTLVHLSLLREPFILSAVPEDMQAVVQGLALWSQVSITDEDAFVKAVHR